LGIFSNFRQRIDTCGEKGEIEKGKKSKKGKREKIPSPLAGEG